MTRREKKFWPGKRYIEFSNTDGGGVSRGAVGLQNKGSWKYGSPTCLHPKFYRVPSWKRRGIVIAVREGTGSKKLREGCTAEPEEIKEAVSVGFRGNYRAGDLSSSGKDARLSFKQGESGDTRKVINVGALGTFAMGKGSIGTCVSSQKKKKRRRNRLATPKKDANWVTEKGLPYMVANSRPAGQKTSRPWVLNKKEATDEDRASKKS